VWLQLSKPSTASMQMFTTAEITYPVGISSFSFREVTGIDIDWSRQPKSVAKSNATAPYTLRSTTTNDDRSIQTLWPEGSYGGIDWNLYINNQANMIEIMNIVMPGLYYGPLGAPFGSKTYVIDSTEGIMESELDGDESWDDLELLKIFHADSDVYRGVEFTAPTVPSTSRGVQFAGPAIRFFAQIVGGSKLLQFVQKVENKGVKPGAIIGLVTVGNNAPPTTGVTSPTTSGPGTSAGPTTSTTSGGSSSGNSTTTSGGTTSGGTTSGGTTSGGTTSGGTTSGGTTTSGTTTSATGGSGNSTTTGA